jgi:hypothetical protein
VNFCLKTGPDARKGFPVSRFSATPLRGLCEAGDPPPCDGRSGFVRADRNHKAGNDAGLTEKETNMSNTKKNEAAETKKAPVDKVRVGLITASIWANETEKGTFHNVTFERRYRDGDGNWKSSHSYNADDLLSLAKAADLAHTRIVELRSGDDE